MPDIPVGAHAFDVAFHPVHSNVYAALITGEIKSFTYNQQGQPSDGFTKKPFKKSCRGIALNEDGSKLWAVGNSKSVYILDTEVGKVCSKRSQAHCTAINRVKHLTSWLVSTGDDDGIIKLWDPRKSDALRSYSHHFDLITDFSWLGDKKHLVTTSADGTLSIVDVRSKKSEPLVHTEDQEEELLCVLPIGENYVVGTQSGLSIFKKINRWDRPHRMAGRSCSVDSLCNLPSKYATPDGKILTGLGNGQVCIEELHPAKIVNIIANHGEFPVERIAVNREGEGTWVASAGHEDTLKLTRLPVDDDVSDQDEEAENRRPTGKESQKSNDETTDHENDRNEAPGDRPVAPRKKRKRKEDRDSKKKGRGHVDSAPSFFAEL